MGRAQLPAGGRRTASHRAARKERVSALGLAQPKLLLDESDGPSQHSGSSRVHHQRRLGNPRIAGASQLVDPAAKPGRGPAAARHQHHPALSPRDGRDLLSSRRPGRNADRRGNARRSGRATPSPSRPAASIKSPTAAAKRCCFCAPACRLTSTKTPSWWNDRPVGRRFPPRRTTGFEAGNTNFSSAVNRILIFGC